MHIHINARSTFNPACHRWKRGRAYLAAHTQHQSTSGGGEAYLPQQQSVLRVPPSQTGSHTRCPCGSKRESSPSFNVGKKLCRRKVVQYLG